MRAIAADTSMEITQLGADVILLYFIEKFVGATKSADRGNIGIYRYYIDIVFGKLLCNSTYFNGAESVPRKSRLVNFIFSSVGNVNIFLSISASQLFNVLH